MSKHSEQNKKDWDAMMDLAGEVTKVRNPLLYDAIMDEPNKPKDSPRPKVPFKQLDKYSKIADVGMWGCVVVLLFVPLVIIWLSSM